MHGLVYRLVSSDKLQPQQHGLVKASQLEFTARTDELRKMANAENQWCVELTRRVEGMSKEIESLWTENSLLGSGKEEANTHVKTFNSYVDEFQGRVSGL